MFRAARPQQIAGGFSNQSRQSRAGGIASRFEAGPSKGLSRGVPQRMRALTVRRASRGICGSRRTKHRPSRTPPATVQMMRSGSQCPPSVLPSTVLGRSWMETRSLIVSCEGLDRRRRTPASLQQFCCRRLSAPLTAMERRTLSRRKFASPRCGWCQGCSSSEREDRGPYPAFPDRARAALGLSPRCNPRSLRQPTWDMLARVSEFIGILSYDSNLLVPEAALVEPGVRAYLAKYE